jgi:hypothetical protein
MPSIGARLFVAALGLAIGGFAIWVFWFASKYGRLPGTDPSLENRGPPSGSMGFLVALLFAGAYLVYVAIH